MYAVPFQPPFLFVDEIVEIRDNWIVGLKKVSFNEEYFHGHFPGMPIMPGTLILESLVQTGGLFFYQRRWHKNTKDFFVILYSVQKVKFRRIVRPGETLKLEVTITHHSRRGGKAKGDAWVFQQKVAEAEFCVGFILKNDFHKERKSFM